MKRKKLGRSVSFRGKISSLVLAVGLPLTGCIWVEGTPSGEMKEQILGSYLAKSLERFYPDGVPSNVNDVYPRLSSIQLKAIESELESLLKGVKGTHDEKREILNAFFVPDLQTSPQAELEVANLNRPTVNVSSQGVISVDVRVLQAVFRGALLESRRTDDGRGFSGAFGPGLSGPQEFDATYVPSAQTEEQRAAIAELVKLINDVRETSGHGDVAADLLAAWGEDDFSDAPWFRMTDFALESQDLQMRYVGASLFLLAHEYGHLALRHHERLSALQEEVSEMERGEEGVFCTARRNYEHEADIYALLLLSPQTQSDSPPPFFDFFGAGQKLTGYRNFFQYGYDLGGFARTTGETCRYPTNKERYDVVEEANTMLTTARSEEFFKALGQAFGE